MKDLKHFPVAVQRPPRARGRATSRRCTSAKKRANPSTSIRKSSASSLRRRHLVTL